MGRPVGHPQRKVLNAIKDTLDLVLQLLTPAQRPGIHPALGWEQL